VPTVDLEVASVDLPLVAENDADAVVLEAVDKAMLYRAIGGPDYTDAAVQDAAICSGLRALRNLRRVGCERWGATWIWIERFVGRYSEITNPGELTLKDDPGNSRILYIGRTIKVKRGYSSATALNDCSGVDD